MESSGEIRALWEEAKAHIEQGDYDKAIERYNYILDRYGDDDIAVQYANAYLGDIYITLRQLGLAEKHIKKAIGFDPGSLAYHYLLGVIYALEARWEEAIRQFRQVVAEEPTNAEYLRGLGWALHCAGDRIRGFEYLHRAIGLAPGNVDILNDLAAAHLAELQFDKAREYAEQALRLAPGNYVARDTLDHAVRFEADFGRFHQDR